MKKLLLVRGDCSGRAGFVWLWWFVFRAVIWFRYRKTHVIETLASPTCKELLAAVANADCLIFYGHGNPGEIRLSSNRDRLTLADVEKMAAVRTRDFELVQISCCDTCKTRAWVDAWLRVSPVVRGYEGVTYDIRRPFVIPDCITYRRDNP